jgi:hypothetical protein
MDEPGTCRTCGAPLKRQTDRRKARGYSLRCSAGGHTRPRGAGPSRPRRSGTRRPKAAQGIVRTTRLRRHQRPVATLSSCSGERVYLYFD